MSEWRVEGRRALPAPVSALPDKGRGGVRRWRLWQEGAGRGALSVCRRGFLQQAAARRGLFIAGPIPCGQPIHHPAPDCAHMGQPRRPVVISPYGPNRLVSPIHQRIAQTLALFSNCASTPARLPHFALPAGLVSPFSLLHAIPGRPGRPSRPRLPLQAPEDASKPRVNFLSLAEQLHKSEPKLSALVDKCSTDWIYDLRRDNAAPQSHLQVFSC